MEPTVVGAPPLLGAPLKLNSWGWNRPYDTDGLRYRLPCSLFRPRCPVQQQHWDAAMRKRRNDFVNPSLKSLVALFRCFSLSVLGS
eukprot:4235142-Pyramimonas_sp.AAC.1